MLHVPSLIGSADDAAFINFSEREGEVDACSCVTFQSHKKQGRTVIGKVDGGSYLALALRSSSAGHWYANRSDGFSEIDGGMMVRLTCRRGGLGCSRVPEEQREFI